MFGKRVTVFMGHYGSGKTFVAVNYALALAKLGRKVGIYDLDIVNPYFRTVDAEAILKAEGIELIVSPYAETNVDIPAMNARSYKMVDDRESYAVADIGGDDRGALALGRFRDKIVEENNYDALLVLNPYRPETRTVEGTLEIIKEIEAAGKLPFTGIVNNANLGDETTTVDVLKGLEFARRVSEESGLPLAFTSVRKDLRNLIKEEIGEVLTVEPVKYGNWI